MCNTPKMRVHYIHLYQSKTPGGIRNVPIAQTLIDMGFLQYVDECKKAGANRIFSHCKFINFSYYKKVSEVLLEHQRELNIKFDQTSFHSFRVNVITEFHNKDANAAKVIKIVRPEEGSGIKTQAVDWGYVRELPDCKKIVDLLEWPIDRDALKYDGRFKDFVANPKNWAPDKEEEAEREKTQEKARKKADVKKQNSKQPS